MNDTPELLPEAGELEAVESRSLFGEWLPTRAQMEKALRLRIELPPDPADGSAVIAADSVLYSSMRQGMGMIFLAGLVAGLFPFVWNWYTAARAGTVVPFAQVGQSASAMQDFRNMGAGVFMADAMQTLAGLTPAVFPGWMAAGLSALGVWINTPLQWLTAWIVYGLAVLLVAKLLGAGTTLQQFYTVTSFGFLPLVLTSLGVIPCLGALITLAALVWAVAVYTTAVRSVTRFSMGMALLCTIIPGAILLLLGALLSVAAAVSVIGLLI